MWLAFKCGAHTMPPESFQQYLCVMNNNKNKEQSSKLTREIWLFEQWLSAIEDQAGDTQNRIKVAYQECIVIRKMKLDTLVKELETETAVPQVCSV